MSESNDETQAVRTESATGVPSFLRRFMTAQETPASSAQPRTDANVSSGLSNLTPPSLESSNLSGENGKPGSSAFGYSSWTRNQRQQQQAEDDLGMQTDIVNSFLNRKVRQNVRSSDSDEKMLMSAVGESDSILRPDMPLRRGWDMYILVLMMYCATFSVFEYSFLGVFGIRKAWFWIERFLDVSFLIDIGLNFFTAFEHRGVLVTDRKAVRNHYLSTWFVPDVISTFPWDIVALVQVGDRQRPSLLQLPRFLRLVRLLKLTRFLRVLRRKRGVTKLEIRMGLKYGYIRLVSLFFFVLFLAHWFACLFYYFGNVVQEAGGTWILQEGIPEDTFGKYIAALYFSVYTITTIGYGDVTPENTVERTYTTVIMFIGAAVFAYVISQVSNVAGELNASSANHRITMDSLTDLAKFRQLPDSLVFDMRRFFQRDYMRQRVADEKELLASMNRDLRIKVLRHIYGAHLENSRFFNGVPSEHLADVYDSVSEKFARTGETLFAASEHPTFFCIILKGNVDVNEVGVPPLRLCSGDIFGENDMLFNRLRRSTAVCTSYSDILVVPREAVMNTLHRHPVAMQKLRDREASWLWEKAMEVVEEQIRYTEMARMMRMKTEAHMLQTGADIGRRSERKDQSSASTANIMSGGALSPLRPDDAAEGTVVAAVALAAKTSNAKASRAAPGQGSVSTVERLTQELEAKGRKIRRLESKLQRLQKQLDEVLTGLRSEL